MSLPQWVYLILAAAIGIPTLAVGGAMALAGVLLAIIALGSGDSAHWGGIVFLLAWASAGLVGLGCWLWISWRYVRQGAAGLRRVAMAAWAGLVVGMVAAMLLAWSMADGLLDGDLMDAGTLLFTGPGLLLPAAWLCWQRLRCRSG